MKNHLRYYYILLVIFVSLAPFSLLKAQKTTLFPNSEITPWYSFEEWIFNSMNWSYETTDFSNYNLHSPVYSNTLDRSPKIYIHGLLYNAQRLNTDFIYFPNFNLDQVDSVIVNTGTKTYKGQSTPRGIIHIYLKNPKHLALFNEISLTNQVNDPGILSSTELRTPNVEFISYDYIGNLYFPSLFNTRLTWDYNDFSRTNVLVYDREQNETLLDRTFSFNGEQSFWPKNKFHNVMLTNSYENNDFMISSLLGYVYSYRFYEWFDFAGIEIPSSDKRTQASFLLSSKTNSVFRNWSLNALTSKHDFILNPNNLEIGLSETRIENHLNFNVQVNDQPLDIGLNTTWYKWEDNSLNTNNSVLINSLAIVSNWHTIPHKSSLILGSHNLQLGHEILARDNMNINFFFAKDDLKGNGYNFGLWNDGIGFSSVDNSSHQVVVNSDLVNTSLEGLVSTFFGSSSSKLSLSIVGKHYWNLVTHTTNYDFIERKKPFQSILTYADNKNVGLAFFQSSFTRKWNNQLHTKTSFTSQFEMYGTLDSEIEARKVPSLNISQKITFTIHSNSIIEGFFRYTSARYYDEFQQLEQKNNWPPTRGRPIYLFSLTSKNYFFDKSAILNISLRNLFNSTESYNTNGQYYNMSINVSASLALGKK